MFNEMTDEDIVGKISKNFLSKCFVSKTEAEERKKKREESIKAIKASKEVTDIKQTLDKEHAKKEIEKIIEEKLDKKLWYSTYDSDFYAYADTFLKTQYPKQIICKYNITSKTIHRYMQSNSSEYKYDKINSKYTGKKNSRVFLMLALKDSWDIIEAELNNTNVNASEKEENKIKGKLDYLFDVLPKTIDFCPLSSLLQIQKNKT